MEKKKDTKKMHVTFSALLAFFLLLHFNANSQSLVTGTVKYADTKKAIANASIVVKESQIGTTTNDDGKFTISCSAGNELVISYVGYPTQNFKVENVLNEISIELMPSSDKLNSVVVVGYQKQSLRKSTAAVQVVSGREIHNLPAPSFDQILQGKVAGVNI